ncbi:MAG: hypothetical protein P1U86_13420 [Verrucomicrobiales bacterium]|nr:hypothetical protein [Verrucomicrobiales bacterium]
MNFRIFFTLTVAILLWGGSTQAQDESPSIPVGTLSAYPTIVQAGTRPQLTWDIVIPETITEVLEVDPPGTITPKRDLIMDVKMLGCGVTYYSGGRLYYVPAECQLSYNNRSYNRIFYGSNYDIDPSEVVFTQVVEEGKAINIGGRYYHDRSWGTWFSTTNHNYNVIALKAGDIPPTTTPMHQAPTIQAFISPYLDEDGRVDIGPRDIIYLMELTHTNRNDDGWDLQDLAVLLTFYDEVVEGSDGRRQQ